MGAKPFSTPCSALGLNTTEKTVLSEGYKHPFYKIKKTMQRPAQKAVEDC